MLPRFRLSGGALRRPLYSELRTIYEATTENPRTFRVTIKLKDMVDETVLQDVVRESGINCDVLYQEQTKYPGFLCP